MIGLRKKEAATCSLDGAVAASIKLVQNNILTQFILQTHYFKIGSLLSMPKVSNKLYITFVGDSLRTVVNSDSIIQYYLQLNSFSLRYALAGPVDIFGHVKGRKVPVNILFIKRNRQLYFVLLSVNNIDSVLSNNYLSSFLEHLLIPKDFN